MMVGDTLEALIADPRSAIWSRETTGAGIRGTRVRTWGSTKWHTSTSLSCQSQDGGLPSGPGHLDAEQAAQAIRSTHPVNAVPVHCGTWWPIGLPQRPDLIDRPAVAFADRVARLAPSTRVHVLRHGQSINL